MPRLIHALMIGIDQYPNPVPKLQGCVNDIDAFASYLSERVNKGSGITLNLKTLKNSEATRQAVIDALRNHLGQAQKGDVALFYYSGHGSQEQAPEEFWKIEPDKLDETLVCVDSRSPGSWDLADKEIGKLIGEVAKNGPHVAGDSRLLPLGLGDAGDRDGRSTRADRPPAQADRVVHRFADRGGSGGDQGRERGTFGVGGGAACAVRRVPVR